MSSDYIDPDEIINAIGEKGRNANKQMRKIFPKIKRWSNIATMISIPLAVFGSAVSNPLITITGASLAGFSKISTEAVKLLENKYKWISFLPKEIDNS
ncbi:MAG: hypothetical protein GF353_08440 [Candidatus Lokiarchaeota archaeon]|nr:hypothetical protein [Candidatus Lokiarchaeota archaeon]